MSPRDILIQAIVAELTGSAAVQNESYNTMDANQPPYGLFDQPRPKLYPFPGKVLPRRRQLKNITLGEQRKIPTKVTLASIGNRNRHFRSSKARRYQKYAYGDNREHLSNYKVDQSRVRLSTPAVLAKALNRGKESLTPREHEYIALRNPSKSAVQSFDQPQRRFLRSVYPRPSSIKKLFPR